MRSLFTVLCLFVIACGSGSGGSARCASCAGCCDTSGACQPGTQVEACGGGGQACVQCSGSDRCSATNKVCGPCGPANCSGCCTADNRCVVEVRERDSFCGFNGSACVDCKATNKTCSTTALACQ